MPRSRSRSPRRKSTKSRSSRKYRDHDRASQSKSPSRSPSPSRRDREKDRDRQDRRRGRSASSSRSRSRSRSGGAKALKAKEEVLEEMPAKPKVKVPKWIKRTKEEEEAERKERKRKRREARAAAEAEAKPQTNGSTADTTATSGPSDAADEKEPAPIISAPTNDKGSLFFHSVHVPLKTIDVDALSKQKEEEAKKAKSKGGGHMIEVVLNDRLGKKVRVKCNSNDTVGDLKKLAAAQLGTRYEKIRIQKWYTIYKDHIRLDDYEIHDGAGLELYYM